jgi:hypothetical protein
MYAVIQVVVCAIPILSSFSGVIRLECHRFHACRYPAKPSDTANKFNPKLHNHVVFIRKNKFFSVPLVDAKGKELSAAELEVYVFFWI